MDVFLEVVLKAVYSVLTSVSITIKTSTEKRIWHLSHKSKSHPPNTSFSVHASHLEDTCDTPAQFQGETPSVQMKGYLIHNEIITLQDTQKMSQ